MAFNLFPFTNLHNLNTDWILKTIKELKAAAETAASQVQEALANAVLYTSQSKTAIEQRVACGNINAVSYLTQGADSADRTVARTNIRAVAYEEQSLTDQQKAQARTNIGAISSSDIPSVTGMVSYTEAQSLTDEQKAQAQTNIGAASTANLATLTYNVNASINTIQGDVAKCVKFIPQTLSSSQQAQALVNIGAASASSISDVLRYSSQSLTYLEQQQARTNIGAADANVVTDLVSAEVYNIVIQETAANVFSITEGNLGDAQLSQDHGAPVIINMVTLLDGMLRGEASFTAESNGNILAFLSSIKAPGVSESTGYLVSITYDGTDDVLTVTPFSFKLMPTCQILDAGKSLTVQSNGAPGWENIKPITVLDTVSTTPTIASAADNTIYKFTQDLTSLSLTAGSGSYMICFHTGSTVTTTSFPVSILGLDDFVPEKDTYYEINIMDGRAVWMGWADPVEE